MRITAPYSECQSEFRGCLRDSQHSPTKEDASCSAQSTTEPTTPSTVVSDAGGQLTDRKITAFKEELMRAESNHSSWTLFRNIEWVWCSVGGINHNDGSFTIKEWDALSFTTTAQLTPVLPASHATILPHSIPTSEIMNFWMQFVSSMSDNLRANSKASLETAGVEILHLKELLMRELV